ncbi:MAG: LPXTG cell wall anchor domain-containing protein [Actinomycetaceae bacterium]|nr:LPXTG cell wall anchor domain-containing protein [Actinomycetaceae bacterium]
MTGASGQLLMIVGGSAIILAALGLGLVALKRRKA